MRIFPISRRPISRRMGAVAATSVAALLCVASPAAADATVSPVSAQQGAGVNLTFRVTNDHPKAAITKVRLVLPPATPVAEVYPLSVPDWAPLLTHRTLNPPMQSIHGGAPVTETTKDILWSATPGKQIAPGASAELMVAMGSLPSSEKIEFTLQATYADGSTGPALSPVSLALTAPAPAAQAAVEDDFSDVIAAAEEDAKTGFWTYAGWLVAALVGAAAIIALISSRRSATSSAADRSAAARPEPQTPDPAASGAGNADDAGDMDEADNTDDADEAGDADNAGGKARTRVTAWSYRDGPA